MSAVLPRAAAIAAGRAVAGLAGRLRARAVARRLGGMRHLALRLARRLLHRLLHRLAATRRLRGECWRRRVIAEASDHLAWDGLADRPLDRSHHRIVLRR